MNQAQTVTILCQFNDWRRGADVLQPKPREIGMAIDAAIEMIERIGKMEQALKAMTKAYKSVPYAQWPAEMHLANEVLEESK